MKGAGLHDAPKTLGMRIECHQVTATTPGEAQEHQQVAWTAWTHLQDCMVAVRPWGEAAPLTSRLPCSPFGCEVKEV